MIKSLSFDMHTHSLTHDHTVQLARQNPVNDHLMRRERERKQEKERERKQEKERERKQEKERERKKRSEETRE